MLPRAGKGFCSHAALFEFYSFLSLFVWFFFFTTSVFLFSPFSFFFPPLQKAEPVWKNASINPVRIRFRWNDCVCAVMFGQAYTCLCFRNHYLAEKCAALLPPQACVAVLLLTATTQKSQNHINK